ncbi:recombinase family protein [Streptomyces sp. W16]|uniref:recombinase family protein n=1 Tax=Streptomyces sp. W16 TaxID=3076631 RepID=UPI003FA3A02E
MWFAEMSSWGRTGIRALEASGVHRLFQEQISTRGRERPEMQAALAAACEYRSLGARVTLVVHELKRLGRGALELLEVADQAAGRDDGLEPHRRCRDRNQHGDRRCGPGRVGRFLGGGRSGWSSDKRRFRPRRARSRGGSRPTTVNCSTSPVRSLACPQPRPRSMPGVHTYNTARSHPRPSRRFGRIRPKHAAQGRIARTVRSPARCAFPGHAVCGVVISPLCRR